MFSLILLAECVFAVRVATSPLLDLLLDGRDVRQQGWVYESVVRPRRNGYEPFAYVLTTPTNGAFGLGYRGLVVEIRQAGDGQLKAISLYAPKYSFTNLALARAA